LKQTAQDPEKGAQLPQIEELTLENPAYGGDTIGRLPDGRAVFVPFSIPGEVVRIRIVTDKKKYARGELLEVLEPSPFRVQPRCGHFGACGGCHYQHIAYEQQLVLKRKILQDQLERIGRLENPPVEPVVPSPEIYNYRNQVQFHIGKGNKPGFIRADKNGVLEIEECHLPQEQMAELWPLIDIDPEIGISKLSLRQGDGEDMLLTLESSHPFTDEFNVESLPISVVHLSPAGEQILAGSDYTVMQVLDRKFKVSAKSFFQINIPLIEQMIAQIQKHIPDGTGLVLELFSGVGLFSAFIAGKVGKLIAIESSPSAGDDFVVNLDEFDNVELYQGRVKQILPQLEIKPDIVLLDPPRTGVNKVALEQIISISPRQILYVSCDPSTLARDSRILTEGGYDPVKFIPYDFFSQTLHIESLSIWIRK
jgi:23S rRNA (uracil1939-C5)-methyltransferase